jgi:hypothetical protein
MPARIDPSGKAACAQPAQSSVEIVRGTGRMIAWSELA